MDKKITNAENKKHIEEWKTCIDVIKNNNNKRNTSNIAFIGLAISTFYIIYKSEVAISWIYLVCIFMCSVGWIMTIYGYRKANQELYEVVYEIEKKWDIKVFSQRHKKSKLELSYEYFFPMLLSCVAAVFFILGIIKSIDK